MVTNATKGLDESSSHLCEELTDQEIARTHRTWTGNDAKGNYRHHGTVSLSESPLDLELSWRKSQFSPSALVGRYRLKLHELLAEGYIRRDPKLNAVRLQFVHDGDGIYIRHLAEKKLRIGSFPREDTSPALR